MQLLNNLQTDPFQAQPRSISQEIDFRIQQPQRDTEPIPIQQHFKQFLLNQSKEIKRNADSKKIDFLGLLRKTHQQRGQPQEFMQQFESMSRGSQRQSKFRNNKTERSDKRDKPQIVFNQFCQRIKNKNKGTNLQSKLSSISVNEQTSKQNINCKSIKSFGSFLENMRTNTSRSQSYSRTIKSTLKVPNIDSSKLKVEGNHKQIKYKYPQSTSKERISSKSSRKSNKLNQQHKQSLTTRTKTLINKQVQNKETTSKRENNEPINVQNNQLKAPQKQEASPKTTNRIHCGYKNFYSPFNGIQIRYISYENQDIFHKQNASLDIKNQNLAITSYKKPFNRMAIKKTITPSSIQKGIVFRYKQPGTKQILQSIQGWRVQPSCDLNSDLCNEF